MFGGLTAMESVLTSESSSLRYDACVHRKEEKEKRKEEELGRKDGRTEGRMSLLACLRCYRCTQKGRRVRMGGLK